MKIGILTFHSARNYGAILQCYALQRYLIENGHRVSIINYSSKTILKPYAIFSIRRILSKNPVKMVKKLYDEIRYFKSRLNRKHAFERFIRNEINLDSAAKLETSQFDLIIVGSDQVWNFKLTGGFDSYYWGKFKKRSGLILASYAASMMDSWEEKYSETLMSCLDNFDYISVREKSIANKLSVLTQKRVNIVVDPTLLLSKEQWSKLDGNDSLLDTQYLLLYQVNDSNRNVIIANQIARELGVTVKILSAREDAVNSKSLRDASPYDFISLFKHARFIVSSSFHGTVFSLIFQKPFVSIRSGKNNENRVETLLNYFNLSHLFISEYRSEKLKLYDKSQNVDISNILSDSTNYLQTITNSPEK